MIVHRKIIAVIVGLVFSLGLGVAGAAPTQAMTYDQYVQWTNSVLDELNAEKGSSAGFRAARAIFNVPKYSKASWDGATVLCKYFRGDSTQAAGGIAADVVWPTEKSLLDTFRSAGGAVYDWDDFMLVRFTVLSSAINAQCPAYNTLVMGPFSDVLNAKFSAYKNAQGGGALAPAPTPSSVPSTPATPTVITDPAAITAALAVKPRPGMIYGFPTTGGDIPPQPSAAVVWRSKGKLFTEVLTKTDVPVTAEQTTISVYDNRSETPKCSRTFLRGEMPPKTFKCPWPYPWGAKDYAIYAVSSYPGGFNSQPLFKLWQMDKRPR